MKSVKLQLLSVCIFVGVFVCLTASTAPAATILWQSSNTDIILGKPYGELEFDNPLTGTEMINQYAVKEWRDASYAFGSPPWYDDWNVNDPANINGYFNEIWMHQAGHSIWTTTTVASTTVSIHLYGDSNDGLADIIVDGILVAQLDMGTPLGSQTALIIVKGLTHTTHHIQINDLGASPGTFGTDVATLGAAALEKHIKWSQPPKPTETQNLYYGWNEPSEYGSDQIVADDWLCDNDDPVTDIHWWGSFKDWKGQDPPLMPERFHITFWTDVPDPSPDDPDTFSHPNDVVWEIDCTNFDYRFVGWDYDPQTNCYEACFLFEQYLTEAEYFYQRTSPDGTPAVYWISIAAVYPDGTIVDNPWGWKARPRMFNDDAVQIRIPTKPHIGDQYVEGKPIYWPDPNNSWDMAFELTSMHVESTIKWEQLPNPELPGIHCHDTQDAAGNYSYITIADDWQCQGGEVTDLHWYGNYEQEIRASGINHFHLSIHKPDPASYCLPDTFESWGIDVPFTAITETDTGLVNSEGSIIYLYEYDLPDPYPQEIDQNYWLDITAFANDPMDPPLWRWQEAQRGAPPILCGAATRTEPPIPGPWQTILWSLDPERYSDMAFAITSTVTPEVYVKWSQPPEPYNPEAYLGWNELSIYNWQQIAADDWFCDTADPVTDIHWWGSYIRWSCEGEPPEVPESFHIAIWTDVPAGVDERFSHPGVVIWETVCNNFTSEFVGWDIDPRNPDALPETCFKFEQDLPEEEWFYQKSGGNIYWISIAANYPAGTEVQYPWGWKTRPRDPQSRAPDDAVRISDPTAPVLGSPYINGEPIFWPTEDDSWDLAFELTTKEIPPKPPVPHLKWSQPPIEIDQDAQPASYKLYANTFQAVDQLLSINPTNGAGTLIGNMSTISPFGLSDRGTELYTFDSFDANSIVKIDPATGNTLQKISINPPGITGEGGLAFRNDGLGFLTSAFGAAGQLWSFDIAVPSSTYIGPVSPSMDGLDFNGSGVLYGLMQFMATGAFPYDLYTIDQTNGATTLVGSTGVPATGTVAGLTFAPDGTLYAAMNDNLYTLNPGSGAATLVGPIGFSGVSGLTALPVTTEPTLPVYCGWDEPSYAFNPPGAPALIKAVADDYRCIGSMPVTSVHWWGSYLGWDNSDLPPTLPESWIITFWSNVPEHTVTHYSFPEMLLWQIPISTDRVKVEMVGRDEFPPNPDIRPETCFQYYVDLKEDEIFWQDEYLDLTQENIFWISIVAVYPDTAEIEHPWGWKTRPWHWMDDAVTFNIDGEIMPNMTLHPDIIDPIDYQGESYDMAFELDTDPNYVKWEQPFTGIRRWPHYEDEESMATVVTTTEVVTKWLQKPDLTEMGVDVDATIDMFMDYPPQLLADDFNCVTTEPITGINIYGSWWRDRLPRLEPGMTDPRNVQFTLSFHTDIPADDSPTGYSMPGDVEWWRLFDAGDFGVEMLPDEVPESYYMPCTGIYSPLDHWTVWKYSFLVPPSEAFVQQGTMDEPVIYWLDVQAQPLDMLQDPNVRFGWKTSEEHWNDDATFAIGREPYNGDWEELIYPPAHLYGGESIDLAFELTAERVNTEFNIHRLVADDWKCEQRTPVTAVVWWGSYIGYEYKPCYDQIMDPPVKPDYFWLAVWTDVPADEDSTIPFSHPNEIIWEYKAYDYDEVLVGFDKHPLSIPGTDPLGREPVFRYSVRLPEDDWFAQRDVNDIYWLSVVAVYTDPLSISQPWGWTNHPHVFNDDAVAGYFDPAAEVWSWNELLDQVDNSEDMSFMLFTDPDECMSVGQVIGDISITQAVYDLWASIGKPFEWCCESNSRGDANLDQYTNPSDVVPIINYLGQATNTTNYLADLNRDGFINPSDVVLIINNLGAFVGPCP